MVLNGKQSLSCQTVISRRSPPHNPTPIPQSYSHQVLSTSLTRCEAPSKTSDPVHSACFSLGLNNTIVSIQSFMNRYGHLAFPTGSISLHLYDQKCTKAFDMATILKGHNSYFAYYYNSIIITVSLLLMLCYYSNYITLIFAFIFRNLVVFLTAYCDGQHLCSVTTHGPPFQQLIFHLHLNSVRWLT